MISYTFSAGSAPALPNAESHCRAADRAVGGRLTDALHIAQENWDTREQLRIISDLRVRYARLAEELRTAIDALPVSD